MRLFRQLTVALEGLPVGGQGGVKEPGGGEFFAGEVSEGCGGQCLVAAFRGIPVLAEMTCFMFKGDEFHRAFGRIRIGRDACGEAVSKEGEDERPCFVTGTVTRLWLDSV